MKKTHLLYGLMIFAMVMVATSCRLHISFSFGKKSPTVDYFSVYSVWDDGALKLGNVRVYSVSEKRYSYLRQAITGKTLIVDMSWKDYLENNTSLVSVLTRPEYDDQDDIDIIFLLSGYDRLQAEMFKQTYGKPYKVYATSMRARKKGFEAGPKLFVVSEEYVLSNKYIHQYNQVEKTKDYLDKVLLGIITEE